MNERPVAGEFERLDGRMEGSGIVIVGDGAAEDNAQHDRQGCEKRFHGELSFLILLSESSLVK